MKRMILKASVMDGDGQRYITVRGQTAKTLKALVEAGPSGVTALEVSTWALRLAAYCHDLRRWHCLDIVTQRESHPHGWHGRHVLVTPVKIDSIEDGNEQGVAA